MPRKVPSAPENVVFYFCIEPCHLACNPSSKAVSSRETVNKASLDYTASSYFKRKERAGKHIQCWQDPSSSSLGQGRQKGWHSYRSQCHINPWEEFTQNSDNKKAQSTQPLFQHGLIHPFLWASFLYCLQIRELDHASSQRWTLSPEWLPFTLC